MNEYIYSHEHVTIDLSGIKKDSDCCMDSRVLALEEFGELTKRNVVTVVDQTARGMGRNTTYTQGIADELGILVLHATGFYKEPFLPQECYTLDQKHLSKIMIDELNIEIDSSGIKASLIGEIGTSKDSVHEIERKVFCAASIAHRETGAPICTHTTLGTLGIEQLKIFDEFNVDLKKVVLSHIDLSGDFDYMLRLVDSGVNIGFDTVGKENYMPDKKRIEWLLKLCERGYSKQIVMSMDITRKSNCSSNGGIGYSFLIDDFLPKLMTAGFKSNWLNEIMLLNPKQIYNI